METKVCRICKIPKTLDCFRIDRGYVRGECKACAAGYRKARYARDPQKYCEATKKWCRENSEKHAATKRAWRQENPDKHLSYSRKILYGISKEEFEKLLTAQNGVCAICKGPPTNGRKNLSVDHCHETNRIRGLLCGKCNTGIGQLNDSVEIVEKALEYLRRFLRS